MDASVAMAPGHQHSHLATFRGPLPILLVSYYWRPVSDRSTSYPNRRLPPFLAACNIAHPLQRGLRGPGGPGLG